ncbi:MAG: ABC transporter permease [Vicinamibacterales bacterium]
MLWHDLRLALRWLRAHPGFSTAALLVFALGIGAVTATFTVIHSVLLRPLPFASPDRVIRIWSSPAGRNLPFFSVSAPDVADWRRRASTLSQVAAYDRQRALTLTGGGEPEHVMGSRVSRELFELLGVPPMAGRWFDDTEDRPGSDARVAVIGYGMWQRRLGGRADAIGQTIGLDDRRWTVIGVMPPGYAIPNNPAEIWLPLQMTIDPVARDDRGLRALARLRDGVSVDEATADLTHVAAALALEHPKTNHTWTVTVRPLTETVVSPTFRRALLVVGGAVALVLLMACANVASLLLSRATTRTREMAVRLALGASRATLVRQMLTESLVLAALGGALGVLVAMWSLDALAALAAGTVPRAGEIALRPAVLVFACSVTSIAALLAGLVPALSASRGRPEALRTREAGDGRGESRARDLIIVGEVAVAMVLLVAAGLMTRSFLHLQQRELGFVSDNLLVVDVAPPAETPPQFYETLLARLGALPGVTSAALGSSLPFAGPNSSNIVGVEGRTFAAGEAPDADFRAVSPDYFRALGIPLLRGRALTSADTKAAPAVVISAAAARLLFPDEDPIGRRIRLGDAPWAATIAGVAGDARYLELEDPSDTIRPMVYLPPELVRSRPMTIALRTAVPPETLVPAVRRAVAGVRPQQPISRVAPMDRILAAVRGPQRFNTSLLAAFAWMALVLAAAGLWGLIAHVVSRRTHEIGIRVALGAGPRDVLRLTAGRGLALAALGIALGTVAAGTATSLLQRVLFDVSATDPTTFAGIAVAFLTVAATASVLPARRALRIDPAEALRLDG